MSFEQQRRNSSRAHGLPQYLELKRATEPQQQQDGGNLGITTPPASGLPRSAMRHKFAHRRAKSSLHMQMPLTPSSPGINVDSDGIQIPATVDEATGSASPIASSPPLDSTGSDTASGWSSSAEKLLESRKRQLDDDHMPASPRSSKTLAIEPSDLIENPIIDLARQDIPMSYVRSKLEARLKSCLGEDASAVCHLRARPLLHESRGLRVRVVPRRDPQRTWTCQFARPRSAVRPQGSTPSSAGLDSVQSHAASALAQSTGATSPSSDSSEFSACSSVNEDDPVKRPSYPVHLEALLARAQPLYQLLLSGKVLRGDTIELFLPHPDDMQTVVRWLYLGCDDLLAAGDTVDPKDEAKLLANAKQIWAIA